MGSMLVGDLGFEKLVRLEELVLGENTLHVMYMLGGSVFLGDVANAVETGEACSSRIIVGRDSRCVGYIGCIPLHSPELDPC